MDVLLFDVITAESVLGQLTWGLPNHRESASEDPVVLATYLETIKTNYDPNF